jgi:hypothetical protein
MRSLTIGMFMLAAAAGSGAPRRPMMHMAAEVVVVEAGLFEVRADVTLTVSMQ